VTNQFCIWRNSAPVFACLLTLAISATAWSVEYTFQTIEYPGATDESATFMLDINNQGLALGSHFVDPDDFGTPFLWQAGEFSDPSVPDFELADVLAIDDAGGIAGYAFDEDGIFGFVSDGTHVDTFLIAADPILGVGFALPTSMSLENDGTLVGAYFEFFAEEAGLFRRVGEDVEVLYTSPDDFIYAARSNNAGTIVGSAETLDGNFYAFMLGDDGLEPFVHPDGDTELYDINDAGVMVGNVTPFFGAPRGFVYADGEFTDIVFPGADITNVSAINNRGWIVGQYGSLDSDKLTGFIAIPIPEPSGFVLGAAAMLGLLRSARRRRLA
jgi:hypothetical protein